MIVIARICWLLALVAPAGLLAAEPDAARLLSLRDRLDTAVAAADRATLMEIGESLEQLAGDWARYYLVYTHSRLGELLIDEDRKQAKRYLNRCIDELKDLLQDQPEHAEALALQAGCYGLSSALYMLRAATRGMAADRALQRARKIAPDNPRVLLQEGISLLYRPAAFGRDVKQARARFQAAAEGFASWEPPSVLAPRWGEAEAWLYLGRAWRALEQPAEARAALLRALEITPGYRAAERELAALESAAASAASGGP